MIKNILTSTKYTVFFAIISLLIFSSCSVDILTYTGTVQNVDVQNGTFTLLTPNSQTETLKIKTGTKITLGGKSTTLASMQIGSDVIAKVDQSDNLVTQVSDLEPAIQSPTPSP